MIPKKQAENSYDWFYFSNFERVPNMAMTERLFSKDGFFGDGTTRVGYSGLMAL